MKDKKIYAILFSIILLLLASPILFKTNITQEVFTSQNTYHNLILKNQINQTEPIIQQIKTHNPFHVLLNQLNLDDVTSAIIIPIISGLISIILTFLILKKLNLSDTEIILSLIMLTLTPIFLNKFTTLNIDNLAFPLMLATSLLYLHKSYFSILPLIILIITNPIIGMLLSLTILISIKYSKNKKLLITLSTISALTITLYFLLNKTISLNLKNMNIDSILIEFGSLTGYSISLIILGVIGIISWWEQKNHKTTMMLLLLTGFIISILFPEIRLIIALTLAIFAGIGITQLISKEWELQEIKQLNILLIACIILFSAIVTLNMQVTQIKPQEVEAAKFLSGHETNNTILSTEDKGFIIEYLSGKKTMLNGQSYKQQNYQEKVDDANNIFYAKKLSNLEKLLKKYDITHIFIHQDMTNGKTWTSPEEGLQFFLKYSEKFIKLYDNEEVQIYKYEPTK